MVKKECIAMLLAGGQGNRLGSLTRKIAKPAVSFGGKYRIIDFSLSNCTNSDIDIVGVLTQYKPFLLNSYIGMGSDWDLDCSQGGGVHILPPYVGEKGGNWYKGTASAIYQNMDFIDFYNPEYVLIISGDHIYKMNYDSMLSFHKQKKADVTISCIKVPLEEASRFGIISVDEEYKILKFREKPPNPDSDLASMGIYIFNWSVLKKALIEDETNRESDNDFGKNVLPMLLEQNKRMYVYGFQGYWKDVGTIESYYQANMDLLSNNPKLNIFDRNFPIFSNNDILPPHYIGSMAKITNCIISNGCTILGEVTNSIIHSGVFVGKDTKIEDSIILPHAKILNGSRLQKVIVNEGAYIDAYCSLDIRNSGNLLEESIEVIDSYCGGADSGCDVERDVNQNSIA
ncbi:glucose-1-phosphate adenylyltransferase [Dehalobacter sp. DCM]|uniref:glucose-1-phosphate adenylyltransferase n=1 Tax=Dehalobacter sp. DCM TaxID=2907827 RepID=UPI003081D57F|nr:glucose-1-phosphate adenylyltransferase [Dehalobacter sp. DCM]